MDLESGVVHENIELSEFLDRLRNSFIAKFLAGDVSGHEKTSLALGFDFLLGDASVFVFVEVDDSNVRALRAKRMATALPIPESPPVISAIFLSSLRDSR
jgi:hypothetical protein